jgi:hypothetical protein
MKPKLVKIIGPGLALGGVIVLTITQLMNDDRAVSVQVAVTLGILALLVGSVISVVQVLSMILPVWVALLLVSIPFYIWMSMIDDLGAIVPGNIFGILITSSVVAFAFRRSRQNQKK